MREFISIQYLRGLAAMLVVLFHIGVSLERMGFSGGWPTGLSSGVDIFFVISGFVMWMSTRDREMTPAQFWWKRTVRILPLYWVITSVILLTLLIMPSILQSSSFDIRHVISSYAFLPYAHPIKHNMMPLLIPGWTLNYEMFFYLIFGLFLLSKPRLRLIGASVTLVALVAAGFILQPAAISVAGFYTSSIILEFGAGMALGAWVHRNGVNGILDQRTGVALLLFGLVTLLVLADLLDLPRGLARGLPAVAIVAGALAIETNGNVKFRWLPHALGDASYSIYLTQMITMAAFFLAWRKLHLDRLTGNFLLFTIAETVFAAVAGYICYIMVEKPLTSLFKRRSKSAPFRGGAIPDAVEEGVTGLLMPERDTRALADAL